jgi:7-cyano-7-deazaguanine synthase
MDSATLLWKLLADGHQVSALSVDYGQRHGIELRAASNLCKSQKVPWSVAALAYGLKDIMQGSSQTDDSIPVPEGHYAEPSMKTTVVPNRNMLLLAVATAHAISLEYDIVAYGAHAGDHAIYPDCRKPFVLALGEAMKLCHYDGGVALHAPFLDMDKGDIANLGMDLGVPYEMTWTCYKGEELHCGKCGACTERKEAFTKFGHTDPTQYADR